jgi:hypothetical protein
LRARNDNARDDFFMKPFHLALSIICFSFVLGSVTIHAQDDTVTIPKSRLEELERKAAELDKLQGQLNQSKAEQDKLRQAKEEADRKAAEEAKAAAAAKAEAEKQAAAAKKSAEDARAATTAAQAEAERQTAAAKKSAEDARAAAAAAQARAATAPTAPAYTAPPMDSLPPLNPGQPVSALDLTAHYVADPVRAASRYGKGLITVEGEIIGFEKPVLITPYNLLLKTGDPARRVVCAVTPPQEYKAVYPAKGGTVLVGINHRGGEVTLLQVGQAVVVEGRCGGLHGQNVILKSCVAKTATVPVVQ